MVNEAVTIAARLCRHFEGLHLKPYLCPKGIPTIGYGATFYEDGRRVSLTDAPITKGRAEQLLEWHLTRYFAPEVVKLCPGIDSPQRLAALIDFTFNLGVGRLRSSTLRKRVIVANWAEAKVELAKWNKSGGVVLRGLTRRRQAEIELIGD